MVFSSTEFLFLFLPALVILYYLPCFKRREWRNVILLVFSIGFYAWGEPVFVVLMLFSVFFNWAVSIFMSKSASRKKLWCSAAIVFNVLLLAAFKYASFISRNIALLFRNDGLILNIALPIGISFFTFQMMSYVFDVYYGTSPAQKNPLHVALYISLFPQLIAGPIVRYNQIESEIDTRDDTFQNVMIGTERFIYGLGKKVLLSNYTGFIADSIFAASERSVATAWLGAIAYTLQIYFDFSGYSDMAIGLGKMFGFNFSENFNYPYISGSVTEFWRRWHISLSTWFRDYVYIPLGGNRVNTHRWFFNMLVVWALTGIWHGANWTFLCWGLFYFILLVAERLTGFEKRLGPISHIYTLLVVVLAWVVFRADTLTAGADYIGNMFGIHSVAFADAVFFVQLRTGVFVIIVSMILSCPLYPKLLAKLPAPKIQQLIRAVLCVVIFTLVVIQVVASTYNPFIYFNF